jgi:hypothetical protein
MDAGMIAQSPGRRVPLPKVEREAMRFLTQPRSPPWRMRSSLAIAR